MAVNMCNVPQLWTIITSHTQCARWRWCTLQIHAAATTFNLRFIWWL